MRWQDARTRGERSSSYRSVRGLVYKSIQTGIRGHRQFPWLVRPRAQEGEGMRLPSEKHSLDLTITYNFGGWRREVGARGRHSA